MTNNNSLLIIGGCVVLLLYLFFTQKEKKNKKSDESFSVLKKPSEYRGNKSSTCLCGFGYSPCMCTEKNVSIGRIGNCSTINRNIDYSMYDPGIYEECSCEYGKCTCTKRENTKNFDIVYNTDLEHTIEPFNRYDIPRRSDCGYSDDPDGEPCNGQISLKLLNSQIRNNQRMKDLAKKRIKKLYNKKFPPGYDVPWWNWSKRIGVYPPNRSDMNQKILNMIDYNENELSDPLLEGFYSTNENVPALDETTTMGLHRYYDPRLIILPDTPNLETCINKCASDKECVSSIFAQDRYTPPTCFVSKQMEFPNDQFDRVYVKSIDGKFEKINNRMKNSKGDNTTEYVVPQLIKDFSIDWKDMEPPKQRTGDFFNRFRHLYREEQRPSTLVTDDATHGKGGNVDPKIIQSSNEIKTTPPKNIPQAPTWSNTQNQYIPPGFVDPNVVLPDQYPILNKSSTQPLGKNGKIDFTAGITQDSKIDAKTEIKSAQDREAERKRDTPWIEHFPFPDDFFNNGNNNVEGFTTDEGTISHTDPKLYLTRYFTNFKTMNPSLYRQCGKRFTSPVDYSPY